MLKGRLQQQQSNVLQALLKDAIVFWITRNTVLDYTFEIVNVQYVMLKILSMSKDETALCVNQKCIVIIIEVLTV